MDLSPQDAFRARVESFLAKTAMPPSRFGKLACGDRQFVFDMRQGKREYRFSTIAKVDRFMDAYRVPSEGERGRQLGASELSDSSA